MSEPTNFGRFQVKSILGRGGMGVVYRAVDPVLDRPVAIKAIDIHPGLADNVVAELEQRFENEARAAAKLSHPNLVTIYDAGREGNTLYIAMELVEGEGLDEILAQGRMLTYKEVADLTLQLAAALDYAHEQGIVHRDIKPANVLVERGGRPRIADFGVARQATSNLTATGTIIGTPAYMSPEQITGHEVTGAADQFSLAVVVYQLLTRRKPFDGEGATTVLYKIVHETPERPVALEQNLPTEVDSVVMRALEKDPRQRYPSCTEFARQVREVLGAAPVDDVVSLTAGAGGGRVMARPTPADETGAEDETHVTVPSRGPQPPPGPGSSVEGSGTPAEVATGVPDGADRPMLRPSVLAVGAAAAVVLAATLIGWALYSSGGPRTSPRPGGGVAGAAPAGESAPVSEEAGPTGPAEAAPSAAGVYRIETRPADSRVTLDGRVLEGSSPFEVELTDEGRHSVRVERDGYRPVSWAFAVSNLTDEQKDSRVLFFPLTAVAPETAAEAPTATPEATADGPPPGPRAEAPTSLPPVDPVRIRGRIDPPEILQRTEPPYPDWAARQGLPVYVVLELVIDEAGRVREASPLGRDVHPSLAELAAAAVREWRFAPARRQDSGDPVAVYFNVSVQFHRTEDSG